MNKRFLISGLITAVVLFILNGVAYMLFLKDFFHDHPAISTEFMEINMDVVKSQRKKVPAITHIDGTSRVQFVNKKTNPLYHKLIYNFYKLTGVPLVLNTSFNDNEPIVCSPSDAIKTFLKTKMDYLAIGDYLISRKSLKNKNA